MECWFSQTDNSAEAGYRRLPENCSMLFGAEIGGYKRRSARQDRISGRGWIVPPGGLQHALGMKEQKVFYYRGSVKTSNFNAQLASQGATEKLSRGAKRGKEAVMLSDRQTDGTTIKRGGLKVGGKRLQRSLCIN